MKLLGDMTMILMSRDGGGSGHHHCRTQCWGEGVSRRECVCGCRPRRCRPKKFQKRSRRKKAHLGRRSSVFDLSRTYTDCSCGQRHGAKLPVGSGVWPCKIAGRRMEGLVKWHEKPGRKVNQATQTPRWCFHPRFLYGTFQYWRQCDGRQESTRLIDGNQSKGGFWSEIDRWRRGRMGT